MVGDPRYRRQIILRARRLERPTGPAVGTNFDATRRQNDTAVRWLEHPTTMPCVLELYPFQLLEQGLGVLIVTGFACIIGAQRLAAHSRELLGRNLGIR